MKKTFLCIAVPVGLLGCHNEDDPSESIDSNYKLEPGIYTSERGNGSFVDRLIDDDNKLWEVYSDINGDIERFNSSNGVVITDNNSGKFKALGKEYSYTDRKSFDINMKGNYTQPKVITGDTTRIDMPTDILVYTANFNETLSNKNQSLTDIANFYSARVYTTSGNATNSDFSIESNGSISGNYYGVNSSFNLNKNCVIKGEVTESKTGRYFNVTLNVLKSNDSEIPCNNNGEIFKGIAFLNQDSSGDLDNRSLASVENNKVVLLTSNEDKSKDLSFSSGYLN